MDSKLKKTAINIAVAASLGAVTATANASHFRGSALIPSIENGILTVVSTSFWRKNTGHSDGIFVNGSGVVRDSTVLDTSDSRYDRRVSTYVLDVSASGAGTYNINTNPNNCCRVGDGTSLGNWSESSWEMNSAIVWDGSTDTAPINFDFATVQPEVSRLAGNDYVQSLNATSADGLTLSYNQDLNANINSQVPGFVVDPVTGVMTITGDANRAMITDNTNFNLGADAAFSGNIIASNGSFVEFDWMFDGVDAAANNAPVVDDAVINALVGPGPINHLFTATDPEDGALTALANWDPTLSLGAGFTGAQPMFDPSTQQLTWDTTGYAPGTYLISARAFDSQAVGDFGTLTVNLCLTLSDPLCGGTPPPPPPPGVPVPGTLALFGLGVTGLGWQLRRRKKGIA